MQTSNKFVWFVVVLVEFAKLRKLVSWNLEEVSNIDLALASLYSQFS